LTEVFIDGLIFTNASFLSLNSFVIIFLVLKIQLGALNFIHRNFVLRETFQQMELLLYYQS